MDNAYDKDREVHRRPNPFVGDERHKVVEKRIVKSVQPEQCGGIPVVERFYHKKEET